MESQDTKKFTKLGKEKVPSISWSNSIRNQLIIAMVEVLKGPSSSTVLKSEDWTSITNLFNLRTELKLSRQQLQNQYTSLKAAYSVYHNFSIQSGFRMNNVTKLVTGTPAAFKEYFAAHPKAKEYEFKKLMFYEELHELFEGKVATGKYANIFTPSPTLAGSKRPYEDNSNDLSLEGIRQEAVFSKASIHEDYDSSDSEDERVGSRVKVMRDEVKVIKRPVVKTKEKPVDTVSKLLRNIVDNQQVVLQRLPTAMSSFSKDYSADLTTLEKLKFKSFLGKDSNADLFSLLEHEEKIALIREILD